MPDREKVKKGIWQCWLPMSSEEYETQCHDCPYYQPGITLEECMTELRTDALAILREQEAVEWINVKDKLPGKDGQYLVVYTFFDYKGMGVVRFSHNLHEIDEYIFDTENRPGWYEPDDEVGYFERTTVTHWAKLPEFPKEGR
jgi:hypothetical protein